MGRSFYGSGSFIGRCYHARQIGKSKLSLLLTFGGGMCYNGDDLYVYPKTVTGAKGMKNYETSDKNAVQEVRNVLDYLSEIRGKKIITGQHTQTMAQEELHNIIRITGKEPALLGFELLSYSPNINYLDTDEECITEVEENRGTLQRAWEWAAKGGLITFTWHWFSPLGGHSKSFFTQNTDFDPMQALIEGTPENAALMADMDCMAGILRPFGDKHIPILVSAQKAEKHVKVQLRSAFRLFESKVLGLISPKTLHYC
jgi:hypothetical protein